MPCSNWNLRNLIKIYIELKRIKKNLRLKCGIKKRVLFVDFVWTSSCLDLHLVFSLCRTRAGCRRDAGLSDAAGEPDGPPPPAPPRRRRKRLQHRNPAGSRRLGGSLSWQGACAELPPDSDEHRKSVLLQINIIYYFFGLEEMLTKDVMITEILWKPLFPKCYI